MTAATKLEIMKDCVFSAFNSPHTEPGESHVNKTFVGQEYFLLRLRCFTRSQVLPGSSFSKDRRKC